MGEKSRGRQVRPSSATPLGPRSEAPAESAGGRETQSSSPPGDGSAEDLATDEDADAWSPEKRRAGYEKLQEFFRELRRALEKRVKAKQREGSSSPSRGA